PDACAPTRRTTPTAHLTPQFVILIIFFFQAEDGIRDATVTGVRRVLFRSCKGDDTQRCRQTRTAVRYVPLGCGGRGVPQESEDRSEERRVGKEGRGRGGGERLKKKEVREG